MTTHAPARGYVGGGHIAAICGESPYQTPFMAWQEIVGEAPEVDPEQLKFFARRKRLEPFILENLEAEHGITIARRNERYTHDQKPHFRAEIDAETVDGVNVEAKSVHHFAAHNWGKDLTDESSVPPFVMMQTNWGMGIHPDRPKLAYAVGQIGFDDCRPYLLKRDDELVGLMQERADRFWIDHVLTGIAPPPSNVEDFKRMPRSLPKVVVATPEVLATMEKLLEVRAQLTELEAKEADLEFAAKAFIYDHDTLTAPGGKVLATWRTSKDSVVVDWKAIAMFCKAPAKVIETFTRTKPGARPFLVK